MVLPSLPEQHEYQRVGGTTSPGNMDKGAVKSRWLLVVALGIIATVTLIDTNRALNYIKTDRLNSGSAPHQPQGLYGPVEPGKSIPLVPGKDRVLVTGAAGFIGMSLSAHLGAKVHAHRVAAVP